MDPTIVAIISASIGMAVGAIIKELGGWANDLIGLKRIRIQVEIAKEKAKMPKEESIEVDTDQGEKP